MGLWRAYYLGANQSGNLFTLGAKPPGQMGMIVKSLAPMLRARAFASTQLAISPWPHSPRPGRPMTVFLAIRPRFGI